MRGLPLLPFPSTTCTFFVSLEGGKWVPSRFHSVIVILLLSLSLVSFSFPHLLLQFSLILTKIAMTVPSSLFFLLHFASRTVWTMQEDEGGREKEGKGRSPPSSHPLFDHSHWSFTVLRDILPSRPSNLHLSLPSSPSLSPPLFLSNHPLIRLHPSIAHNFSFLFFFIPLFYSSIHVHSIAPFPSFAPSFSDHPQLLFCTCSLHSLTSLTSSFQFSILVKFHHWSTSSFYNGGRSTRSHTSI